ncbi:MAG: hypothetical protein HQL20_03170 [Candidatus Omnitrophica bacterium]|nr:hypothetical protein [Candidatus Omnitrophota bacterium]
MKKLILLTMAGVMFSSMAYAVRPEAESAVNAALDQISQGGVAPRWKSSLGGIEEAIAVLVEANQRLMQEYQALSAQMSALEADITSQHQKNNEQDSALAARRAEVSVPAADGVERQKLALLGKDTEQARLAAAAAQSRLKSVDSKLGLRKLKVQELELEKKSLLMDRNARTVATLGLLKQSVKSLKDQADYQKSQTEYVRQKIAALNSVDRPFLKESGQLLADNTKLRQDLAKLMDERADLLKQADSAVDKKNKAATGADSKRLQDLTTRKASLETRLAAAKAKKDKFTAIADSYAVDSAALAVQIKGLEDENKALEEAAGNVRENIAVLEYRMNSLTRYKNRNSNRN